MHNRSIRRRLLSTVLGTQLVLTVGVVLIAVGLTRSQLRTSFDAGLHSRAISVAALVRYSEDANPRLVFDSEALPPSLDREHTDVFRVVDSTGKVIAVSPNWPNRFEPAPGSGREYWNLRIEGSPYRAVRLASIPVLDQEAGVTNGQERVSVFYASSTEDMSASVRRAAILIVVASLLLLAIATVFAVWTINRGLLPLSVLAQSAASISPTNWELHPPQESLFTAELAPLTRAMTTMLAGLQQAFSSQSAFVADAAHELKTPVAILKSTLQSLLQRPRSSDEYRAGLEATLDDTVRLEKLVHSMLRLARAEQWAAGNLPRDLHAIDLTSTCELSIAHLRTLAGTQEVNVQLVPDGVPRVAADAEDLEVVWENLLENALRYSPKHGNVKMAISQVDGWAEVAVQDQGPGIPQSELAHIFERFHRADTSRARSSGGYGLGLSIAKAIVEAYGGTISVQSRLGDGTTMVVRLPASR